MGEQPERPADRVIHRKPTLVALAIFVTLVALTVYGPDFGVEWGGIAMLLGIPFALGMLVGQAIDRDQTMGCFVWPTLSVIALLFVAYLIFGEGVICIAMVMPIWIAAAVGGAVASIWTYRRKVEGNDQEDSHRISLAAWTVLPVFLVAAETTLRPAWSEHEVIREVTVRARPADVWPHLVEIRNVGSGEGRWTFSHDVLGIPRPVDAQVVHLNGTAVRKAQWGEGIRFEERIVYERPGTAMRWRFVFPDTSLQDHTDRHIAPDGESLRILSGGYELQPLPGGQTRIRLITRYAMKTRLPDYMAWWGERLLGDVQNNVLQVIADRVGS
jgi:hypothetical protein